VTGYLLGDWGFDPRWRQRILTLPSVPSWLWGPHRLLYSGYQGFFPWHKVWPGHDADHSPPPSVKVKKEWELYLPPSASMACSGTALLFTLHLLKSTKSVPRHDFTLWRSPSNTEFLVKWFLSKNDMSVLNTDCNDLVGPMWLLNIPET
jgi:hypothetical protein